MLKTYVAKIRGEYYAFAGDIAKDQVYSIGKDNPPKESGAGCYFASWSTGGIPWVATPSPSRKCAVAKAKRHGEYGGEVWA